MQIKYNIKFHYKLLDFLLFIIYNSLSDTESCPSWSKEHDWKSCNGPKPVRGFESLALRQIITAILIPKLR